LKGARDVERRRKAGRELVDQLAQVPHELFVLPEAHQLERCEESIRHSCGLAGEDTWLGGPGEAHHKQPDALARSRQGEEKRRGRPKV
jgi:hypothetical protein